MNKKKTYALILSLILLLSVATPAYGLDINSLFASTSNSLTQRIENLFAQTPAYFKAIVAKFADLGNHWADETIGQLVELGAIGGYADGTFKPDANITRAEFSKILAKSLDLKNVSGSAFNDTKNHWAKDDINTLVQNGIINKADYGTNFEPDKKITRLEIAKMTVRAIGQDAEAIAKAGQSTGFADNSSIKSSDRGYVIIAKNNKIVGGYGDNTFKPNNNATRAEASAMVVRTLKVIKDGVKVELPLPIENGVVIADKLPKETVTEAGMGEVANVSKQEYNEITKRYFDVDEVISMNEDLFPLKYEKLIIKSFEHIPYNNSFLVGTNQPGWGNGSPYDLYIIQADITETHNMVGAYIANFLDKDNNVIVDRLSAKCLEGGTNTFNKKALQIYPNMPVENQGFDAIQSGKTTLVWAISKASADKTTKVTFHYRNMDNHTADLLVFDIN